jgi:energy-coupling factor transporter ATP-binding protein EcfA2
MGLCLFFALNKYLVKDAIEVIILDDVVMSIDTGHRRGVCDLLKNPQLKRQIIITTHDTAWAKQLKSQGIVKRENMIHFTNWNIETGPIYEIEKDLWTKINEDLNKDDIPAAAHRLRRNAESFFDDVCDSLGAEIRYKGVHQWEFGDYAMAAIRTYKKYLKKGKNNAQSIGSHEKFKDLEELEKKSNAIFEKSQIEQWIVNENVHYNKWETFNKEDFIPLVAAYKDLFSLFTCTTCGSLIALTENRGQNPRANVSCNCGKTFWDVS